MNTQATQLARTILTYLRETHNLELLPQVVASLRDSSEYKHAENRVVVTSATDLDASELKGLRSYIEKSLGDAYELEQVVDPQLVAGFTLQINDTLIDASLLGKISSIQHKLLTKDSHEK
jgi:ATP synthase F1 delta subunit